MNLIGEVLDTIVSLSGKYGRWLNVKGNRICFLIWVGCATYWTVRDVYLELYSQAFFCVLSVGLNAYGFINWGKKRIFKDG